MTLQSVQLKRVPTVLDSSESINKSETNLQTEVLGLFLFEDPYKGVKEVTFI